ncbi:hypothetical protein BDA99DRAFT_494306 [Phascolomyces articulosus]|uniref:Uncharacterized protein n=1 Tax=Phascolomyces articulosus TaxID=60185 RepID=A0AAD5PJJ2_9FUNG|nr:hypothetical protein BDA99DRAFT_494306 [Phascolomyces articulosus]
MIPFLGSHVDSICFNIVPYDPSDHDKNFVLDLLQLLLDHDCNRIISMAFTACGFVDHDRFISILKRLGRYTETIAFEDYRTNLPFLSIIEACPNLEQLAYTPTQVYHIDVDEIWHGDPGAITDLDDDFDDETFDQQVATSTESLFPKMTVLSIDLAMSFHKRLAPIIRRCPNLRVLRTGNVREEQRFTMYLTPISETANMMRTFQWCPILQYIELNNPHQDEDMILYKCFWWRIQWDKLNANPKEGNLFTLIFYEPDEFQSATYLINEIIKSQKLLKELALGADRSSDAIWDGISGIEHAPSLTKLYLDGIRCSEASAAAVIEACPAVKDLMINIETDGHGYAPVLQAMCSLTKLRNLTVNYKSNRFQDDEEDDEYDAGNWREQLARRHNRQLAPITNYLNGLNQRTPLEKLEIRGRWDLVLTAPFLYSIGSISTLRQLELRPGDTELTTDEVVQFIRELRNTQVYIMTLSMFANMSPEAYVAMAELEHLNKLELIVCEPCQNKDLIHLFEKSNSIDSLLLDMGILSESPFPQAGVEYLQRNKICSTFGPSREQRGIQLFRYPG